MDKLPIDIETIKFAETSEPLRIAEVLTEQDHKIAVLERALELACENIERTVAERVDCKGGCPLYICDINDNRLCYEKMAHYFKSQAESEIKNEKE